MRLYGTCGSGNCWKAEQILRLTGHAFEWVETGFGPGGTRSPEFLAMNPMGKVPVVVLHDGTALRESNALLLHFAEGTPWLPPPGLARTRVHEWLFFEQYSHEPAIAVARFLIAWKREAHLHEAKFAECAAKGAAALHVMERHLAGAPWLAGEGPTIADLALFAYTHRAEEAGFDLAGWPAVRAWVERVAVLPGIEVIPPLGEILSRAG